VSSFTTLPIRPRILCCLAAVCACLPGPAGAAAATPSTAARALQKALDTHLRRAAPAHGAYVADLTSGRVLYARRAAVRRIPASVEKLYTTSTALRRYGATARLRTAVYGDGRIDDGGVYRGDLYLKGFGDPTFGSAQFTRRAYGTGATVDALAKGLVEEFGISRVVGHVYGDETYFDRRRGTIYSNFALNSDIEGSLSALAFNRGLANERGTAFALRPADFAADRLVAALKALGVAVSRGGNTGTMPTGTPLLTYVNSPQMQLLTRLTDIPSDNYLAEMLLKGLGARFGAGGTSFEGAQVVKASLADYGIDPSVVDGSGLSRIDRTSPRELVALLGGMQADSESSAFEASLPTAGRTGTLAGRMRGTAAAGRCHAKTGTLSNVSALAGYCDTRSGDTVAFAFMMNRTSVYTARAIQDAMTALVAAYR
jgi:D-alanyl-D-alanine carboxypeptidase/D-alanyl-D-alanine-endopeptidase (penicillin-binding protein 4)